jgi:hypothetical protein
MASGAGLPLWILLAGWAGVMCVAAPLAGRECSLPGIAATLLGEELGLHLLFSLGRGRTMAVPAGQSGGDIALAERLMCNAQHLTPQRATMIVRQAGIDPSKAMPGMHRMPAMSAMTGMPGIASPGAHAMPLSAMFTPSMLATHLAAAVFLGWLLRRGEAALWRVIRLSAVVAEHVAALLPLTALLALVRVLALVASLLERRLSSVHPRRAEEYAARLQSVALQHCVTRRGPPAVALTA